MADKCNLCYRCRYFDRNYIKLHEATIRRCLSDILTELSELKKVVESDEREEL